jgi:uncharacterized membrane protein YfcA
MTPLELAGVAAAAVGAGFVNAVAGGGTLISFPTLTAMGVPPVAANITNTIALCPGFIGGMFGQRADLRGQAARLRWMVPAGAFGGVVGAVLLLFTDQRVFRALVPFLILLASLLLAAQGPIRSLLLRQAGRRHAATSDPGPQTPDPGPRTPASLTALPVAAAAIYGGYFGAGLGVILLASLGLLLADTLTRLNALKQAISFAANVAAAMVFVGSGQVVWPAAGVMAVGALAGGALGGRLAGAINPDVLRRLVVAAGLIVSVVYFLRR